MAILALGIAGGYSGSLWAQTAERRLEPSHLREDFAILRGALQAAHIGLYRYTSKQVIDEAFDAASKEFDVELTEVQFLSRISQVLALIRDDHTFALPSQALWSLRFGTAGTAEKQSERAKVLPAFVRVEGDRFFVTHDNSRERSIPIGSEIRSINGKPVTDLLRTLDRYMPTSGRSEVFRRRHLDQYNVMQEFNYLCIYYAMFIEAPDVFEIQIRRPAGGSEETIRVAGLSYADVLQNFRERYERTDDPLFARARPISLSFVDRQAALLTLPSFHDWQWNRQGLKFQAEISNAFQSIIAKQVRCLIIDLRGNEGGSAGIGIEVLAHLATAPFRVYQYKEMLGYRFPKYAPYMRDPKGLDNLTDALFEMTPKGTFRVKTTLPDETWSRPMNPATNPFAGKVYVLIDGATGSAAGQLATLIRVNRRDAVFIGEESGGDMEGPVSNSYLDLQLPHSGIRVDIPLMKKMMNLNGYPHESGRGVIPDYEISWTGDDIDGHRDPVLEFALKLINRNENSK